MGDLRRLLESEELKAAVSAIDALQKEAAKNRVMANQRFAHLVLGKEFKANEVLAVLTSDDEYYPGFKPVLAAGLAGWLVEPEYNAVMLDAMSRVALAHMDNAETQAGLGKRNWDLKRDIASRYILAGPEFLGEIFYELGGYTAFSEAFNEETAQIVVDAERVKLNTIVRAMAYFHYGANLMDKGGVLPPSLNRAVLVFAGLKEKGPDFSERYVSRSLLHERWTRAKATLALLYAASSINVGPQTLYEIIVDQKFSYDGHKKILNRWMRRARYVSEHIFSRAADPELRAISEKVLGMGDSERFPLPLMSAVEHKLLSNVFPTKA